MLNHHRTLVVRKEFTPLTFWRTCWLLSTMESRWRNRIGILDRDGLSKVYGDLRKEKENGLPVNGKNKRQAITQGLLLETRQSCYERM